VIPEIPLPREARSRLGTLAAFIAAEIRLISMTMHGVGLTLMTK
jgi:hypothetical protein